MASNFDDDMSYGSDLENINDDDDSSYEEAINDDGNFPEDYKGEEIMTNNGGVNINDKRVVDFQNRKMKKMAKEMSLIEKKLEELTQQNSELQVQNKQLEREKLFNETKADELHDTLNALKNHEVHDALMSKSLQLAEVLTDSDMLRAQVRDMQKERDAEKSKLIGLSVVVRSLQSLASQNEEDEEDLDSEEESEEIVLTAESALDMTLKNMKFQIEDLEEERQRLATKCKEQSATIESMTKQNEMYEVKVEMLEELFRSFNEERTKTEEPTNNEGRPSQAKTESPPSPPIKSEAPSSASSYKCSVCGAAASAIEGAADTVSKETIAARCAPIKNPTTPRNPGLSSDALSVDTDESETEKDTGIFLQSESKVVLREVIKAESDDDEAAAVRPGDNGTTTSLSNGGGFAVLQQQDVTVFIKKVSRTEQSRFIKSGDTVMFKMVRGGGTGETGETRYLSLHRGWWLKWVSSPPGKNSSFNIYAQNEPQFGEQMPDFLTMGASFTLRHKRWSDYLVGVSQDPSTAYGGRMLGLYKSEDDEQEDEDQYTSDEGEMDLEGNGQQFDFQSTKTGRMKPLVLCAHYPNGSLLDRSFNNSPMKSPKSLVSPSNLPAPGLDKKLLFSDIHSEADVPAWIEMMNRTERTTQLTYVLRIVHREPKEDGEEKEDSVLPGPSEQEPYSFSKLRAGRELARVLLIGQNKKKEKRARRGSMFGASTHSCERRVERRGSMLGNSTHSGKNSWFDLSMRSFDDDDLSSESSSDDGSVDSFADDNSDDYLSVDFSIESAEFTGTLKSVDDFSDSYTTNNNTQKSYETFNNSKGSTQKSFESFGKEDDESSSESESESENEPANEPANESVHSPRGRAAPERWGMISRSKSENPSYFPRGRAPLEGQVESELADESGHSPRGRAPPERRGLVKHKSMETELANESGHTPRGQRRGGLVKQNSIMRFGKAAKNKVVGTGKFAAKTVKETAKTTGKLTRDTVVGTGKLAAKTVKETGKLTKNTMKETGKHVKGTIKEAARGGLKVAKGTVKAAKVVSAIPGKPKAKKREKSPLGVKIEVAKDMKNIARMEAKAAENQNPPLLAGELCEPEESCRMASSVLSRMSNVPFMSSLWQKYNAFLTAHVKVVSDEDRWFLEGNAVQLGVTPDASSRGALLHESLVARCLWESHWREEWCGMYEKCVCFYAPLSSNPCQEIPFDDIINVRPLDAGCRSPLPGYPVLVLETAWLCHYIAFRNAEVRDVFAEKLIEKQMEEVVESSTRKARMCRGFQNLSVASLTSGTGKWCAINLNQKPKERVIFNGRRLAFDKDGIPRGAMSDGYNFVEDLLAKALSFSPKSLEKDPDKFIKFLDLTSQLRSIPLEEIDFSSRHAFCFFANIYHCLFQQALILSVNGRLDKKLAPLFMRTSCYEVGGEVFSLAELYNHVLRGNMTKLHEPKAPYIDAPRKSKSYRLYTLDFKDPLVNFVLSTGDLSCPATIPVLRAQNLDIQLSEAAATFLKKEMEIHTKFQGDTKKQIVTLPKICEIYKSDFGESGMDVLKFCAGELEEEFASEFLESLTTEEKSLEIRYKEASESYHSAFVIERDSALQINQVVLNADDPRIKDDFSSYTIAVSDRLFNQLKSSVWSEEMSRGRRSAVLVMNDQTRGTPIVRTTNKCNVPSMYFPIAYNRLAQHIQKTLSLPTAFNNAVIENYSNEYGNSSFQSDQSLDLQDGSVIALFSCYRDPELGNQTPRKLVIQSKEPRGDVFQIPLTHNSVVIFSLDTNQRFRHKIVVDAEADSPENLWLGVTFRTSKTFVEYHEDSKRAVLEDGAPLTLANDTQSLEFYRLVRRENQETNFVYPKLTYSISEGDIMPPTNMR